MERTDNAAAKQDWDEDAERVNKLAALAKQKGMTITVTPKKTPKLKRDGSMDKTTTTSKTQNEEGDDLSFVEVRDKKGNLVSRKGDEK